MISIINHEIVITIINIIISFGISVGLSVAATKNYLELNSITGCK